MARELAEAESAARDAAVAAARDAAVRGTLGDFCPHLLQVHFPDVHSGTALIQGQQAVHTFLPRVHKYSPNLKTQNPGCKTHSVPHADL